MKKTAQLHSPDKHKTDKAIQIPDVKEILAKSEPLPRSHFSPISAISLFTGAGGMDLGFEVAGFSTRCCIEIDTYSCLTLQSNKNVGLKTGFHSFLEESFILCEDIRKVDLAKVLNLANVKKNCLDLIHGGPPCQAFSVFGKRQGLDDERGTLLWEFVRFVNELKPKSFVLENVEGLKTYNNSSVLDVLKSKLSFDGKYTLSLHEYEMADYGIPQSRKRIFLIGSLKGKTVPPMTPTHGEMPVLSVKPYRTVGEVLKGLGEPKDTYLPNHTGRKHSKVITERYAALALGKRDSNTRINKLHPHRPSFTIVVGSDAGGGKGHIHPYSPREVTPRESARMQTFPDFWAFSGTSKHPIRQVGNAVPPLFAALFAAHLRKHLFDEQVHLSYEEAINYLGLDYLKQ